MWQDQITSPSTQVTAFTTGLLQLYWNGSEEDRETGPFVEFKKVRYIYKNRVFQDKERDLNCPIKQL